MKKTIEIGQVAKVLRSKNAGPFLLTMDIMFDDAASYEKVKKSQVINKKLIAKLYKVEDKNKISVINYDPALAIKITLPRQVSSGGIGDTDVYGAQQHVPLYSIKIPRL